MDVGVNYPWFNYGWDFGDAPPGWRKDSDPNWVSLIDADLQYLYSLRIKVVRWFVFCDGLAYGSGDQAPHQDQAGKWRFDDPPKLSDSFQKHFRKLLESFANANSKFAPPIQLMPVLLDYRSCRSGYDALRQPQTTSAEPKQRREWVCCGRSDIVVNNTTRDKFYKNALQPLLDISKDLSPVIFAWDIFNEPEWVTTGWNPYKAMDLPVPEQKMYEFLRDAISRVKNAGFKTTVGFNRFETIARSKLSCDYTQFHYYPDKDPVVNNKFGKVGVIGEFGTTRTPNEWPELGDKQSVCDRLKHIEKKNYPLAMPWSMMGKDDHTSWGDGEEGIKKYYTGTCST